LVKRTVEGSRVKNIPIVDVGNDEVFYIRVVVLNAFLEVIKHHFVHGPGIAVSRADHFIDILRAFDLKEYGSFARSRFTFVDDEVCTTFRIHKVQVFVPSIVQKIPQMVFCIFFAFFVVYAIEQARQIGLELLYLSTIGLYLLVRLIQRFLKWDDRKIHCGLMLFMKTIGKIKQRRDITIN